MPKSFTTLVGEIATDLADTANATWPASEISTQLEKVLREVSEYVPYVIRESYRFETRNGKATATAASALADTVNSQFGSGDVNKQVFNLTARTWAKITSFANTGQVGLSDNIFTINDQYEIYNEDCRDQRQINLKNITDYVDRGNNHGVRAVIYGVDDSPTYRRSWQFEGEGNHIMTVLLDATPPDSGASSANVEVFVDLNTRQRVCQLTDLSGLTTGTAAAGATTLAMSALQGAGTIREGDMFTVTGIRGTYRVTANTTIASSASSAVPFWPGLTAALASTGAVISFVNSTLDAGLERLVEKLTRAECMIAGSGAMNRYDNVSIGGNVADRLRTDGQALRQEALAELRARTPARIRRSFSQE